MKVFICNILILTIFIFTGCSTVIDNPISTNSEKLEIENDSNIVNTSTEDESTISQVEDDMDTSITYSYAKVFADTLNVRNKSNTNGEIINRIDINTIVEIIDEYEDKDGNIWYRINLDGFEESWIASWYCSPVESMVNNTLDYKIIDPTTVKEELEASYFIEFNVIDNKYNYILDYDLNNDDTNEKLFILPTESGSVIVEYNGLSLELEFGYDKVLAFGLLDTYYGDDYYEFYTLSDYVVAPHAIYNFYRFDDNKLNKIGSLNSLIQHVDGSGRLFYWGGQLFESVKTDFNYDLVMQYYDIFLDSLVKVDTVIGKTFTSEYHKLVVFKELEYVYKDVWEQMDWVKEEHEGEYITILNEGDMFTLIRVDENDYEIKLADGSIGWVTGFHFYID